MKFGLKDEFLLMALEAKEHLEKHMAAICEIRVEKEHMEDAKAIISEAVGQQLFKRINFFPKMSEAE